MKRWITYIVLFAPSLFFAQKITTSLDSVTKKIGAEFKLTLKTEAKPGAKIIFPNPKTIGMLEVIESYPVDTLKEENKTIVRKKYGLAQYEPGKYVIEKVPVLINGKKAYSDGYVVEVTDVKVDTLKQKLYDIKEVAEEQEPFNWFLFWLIIGIVVGVAAVALLLWKFFRGKHKTIKKENPTPEHNLPPLEKATLLLQQLENENLPAKGEVKKHYSILTDIARNYIEEEINVPAKESTTSELLEMLRVASKSKKLNLSKETLTALQSVLSQADLVKFAKVIPAEESIRQDTALISETLKTIHEAIPVETQTEEELGKWQREQLEKERLEELARQQRRKKRLIAGAIALIPVVVFGSLVLAFGYKNVRDYILGNTTRDLLESKEWITSEYGNPFIRIETPRVLIRKEAAGFLPGNVLKTIKQVQFFEYGLFTDDFYIVLSTLKNKTGNTDDFQKISEGAIKNMEYWGAKNLIVKTEPFSTSKGIEGLKAYGSFIHEESKKKMEYQILFFAQDGGIQQIGIHYPADDTYGKELTERILNSVELNLLQK